MTKQIIPPELYERILAKHPKVIIGCVLFFCFVIVPFVHIAIDKEWFKRKAIEVKYCYHWECDTVLPFRMYEKGQGYKCFEKSYWMLAYYYTPDSLFPNKSTDYFRSDFHLQNWIYKVEVLRYSEDSLLAIIRYKYPSCGIYGERVVVVPSFTLHDTLPAGYEAENEEYMKDIKMKKLKL